MGRERERNFLGVAAWYPNFAVACIVSELPRDAAHHVCESLSLFVSCYARFSSYSAARDLDVMPVSSCALELHDKNSFPVSYRLSSSFW